MRDEIKEEERKLDLVEEVIEKKDLADEADLLLLRRNDKEMQVGQFLEYLVGLNLLNGLYLTEEQMDRILTCLRKKERVLKSEEWNRVLKGYLAVKDVLEEYGRMNDESEAIFFYAEALHMRLMEEMGGVSGRRSASWRPRWTSTRSPRGRSWMRTTCAGGSSGICWTRALYQSSTGNGGR